MEDNNQLPGLLRGYVSGSLSEEELLQLADLVNAAGDDEVLMLLQEIWTETEAEEEVFSADESAIMLNSILGNEEVKEKPPQISLVRKIVYAAVAAAAILVMVFTLRPKSPEPGIQPLAGVPIDITPGTQKAVLILSNGEELPLDSNANGVIAMQGGGEVRKNGAGISYGSANSGELLYNTIQTPRGGEYRVELSDGTIVYLNAASSLRYPVRFTGNERKVELFGEGFFEVAKDKSRPFKVNIAGKAEVEVLGTQFNINAYENEAAINTVLVEGKVRFRSDDTRSLELQPGEQASEFPDGRVALERNVNLDEVTAWKKGQFFVEKADVKTILRQVERWYDIEVVYEGAIDPKKYFVIISRKSKLSEVLQALQANNVKYRIEGKRLMVQGSLQ